MYFLYAFPCPWTLRLFLDVACYEQSSSDEAMQLPLELLI